MATDTDSATAHEIHEDKPEHERLTPAEVFDVVADQETDLDWHGLWHFRYGREGKVQS